MKSHFTIGQGVAMACAVAGASTLLTDTSLAATFTAADYATNAAYADGWQTNDNGGFGFSQWSFVGTYTNATQHAMNTNSTYNQLGVAWTLYLPNGKPAFGQGQVDSPNAPQDGSDLSRAGRGFSPLQPGQTLSTVIDNPTERHFFNGYTVNFITGGSCAGFDTNCMGASRLRVGTFEYFTMGRWYVDSVEGGSPNLFDTNSAAAGMRLDVTLTGPNNYQLIMTPLNNPANAYTNVGTLIGAGPIDWIQFEHYNTDSDFYDAAGPHAATNPKSTDLYIRSITITEAQLLPIVPTIVKQPKSKMLYAGRTARFEVESLGSLLSYQWRKNGVNLTNGSNISGSQTNQLVISNISAADVAAYTVVVTNSLGAATSSPPATLTLAPPSTNPYETAAVSYGPIAHWRLNETNNPAPGNAVAQDYYGGYAGLYGSASANRFTGTLGPVPADGFSFFETTNGAMASAAANSWATMPALNLNNDKATVTAWINPDGSQPDFAGLVYSRFKNRAVGLTYGGAGYGTSDQLSYTWNNNSEETYGFFSGLGIPAGQWSFIALVVEPAKAVLYVYNTNGQASATNSIPHVVEPWDGPIVVGGDPENNIARTFNGRIDEVAIFNRALSPTEISNLYHAVAAPAPPSVTISIQKSGPNVILNWPQGTLLEATDLAGPWATNSASSPYTNAATSSRKFYRVRVQ